MKNNKLSVCFIDTLGLLYNGNTVYERGLGGSESAIIYIGEELSKLGIDVTVYNRCDAEGTYRGVKYIDIGKIKDNNRTFDVLISSRSMLPLVPQRFGVEVWEKYRKDIGVYENIVPQAKFKAVWLHDTFIEGEEYLEPLLVDGEVQEVFLLSDWHSHYVSHANHWNTPKREYASIKKFIFQTRNGLRPYSKPPVISEKDPNLFVYNSSITKGMVPLVTEIWADVKKAIPDAKLTVIGGYYRGAGANNTADESEIAYFKMKDAFDGKNGVTFTGIITQKEIASILCKSTYMIYPPDFPETFGISTLEALYYNVIPITSRHGALEQIAIEDMSYLMNYSIRHDESQKERFVELVKYAYYNKYLTQQKQNKCNEVQPWVSWEGVARQWKSHFFRKFDMMMTREENEVSREITNNYNRIFKVRHVNLEDNVEYFPNKEEARILVITPMYNAEEYIESCINSVAMQEYDSYVQYIIDDCSTDNSVQKAKDAISKLPEHLQGRFYIKQNEKNVGALANQALNIKRYSNPDDIVALLDGDDWLYNDSKIFTYINSLYPKYKMSYGSCWSLADNIPLIAQEYPEDVKRNKAYKEHKFNWGIPYTHLRTFAVTLFNSCDQKKLLDGEGNYYKAGGDGSLMYALLEASNPEEIKAVTRILVNYNDKNPLNDYKVNPEEQTRNQHLIVKSENDPYGITELSEIHRGVLQRDEKSMLRYKEIVTGRPLAWIDDLNGMWIKPRLDWVISTMERLNVPKTAKILDIGSWTGNLSNALYKLGYTNITCLDINEDVVKLGTETFPYFDWLHGDIETCQLEEQYDVVFMFEVLEHLFNPMETISKVKEHLTEDGVLLYTVPTPEVVMGTHEDASEHVSIIHREEIGPLSSFVESIEIPSGYKWICGGIKKNLPTNNKPVKHILIGIPTAKNIESSTFKSIYDLQVPEGCKTHIQFFYGYNIAQIRNLMANYTIINNFDYMMWVDSDIVLPSNTLMKLYGHQKDCVGGIYIQRKHGETTPEVYLPTEHGGMRNATVKEVQEPRLMEVAGIGFGCVLTSNKLLKKIGYPQFEYKSTLDFKDTVSEDVDFCVKANKNGFSVFADTSIRCDHIGAHTFKQP